jgi:hypothetical protein
MERKTLENSEAGNDRAIGQVGGALDMFAVVHIFRQADLWLENLNELLHAGLLSTQLLERLQDLAQLSRCLIVGKPVNIFMHVLSHRSSPRMKV